MGIPNVDKNQYRPFDENAKNHHSNDCVMPKQTTNFDPLKQHLKKNSNKVRSCHDNENNSRSDEGIHKEPDIIVTAIHDSIKKYSNI